MPSPQLTPVTVPFGSVARTSPAQARSMTGAYSERASSPARTPLASAVSAMAVTEVSR